MKLSSSLLCVLVLCCVGVSVYAKYKTNDFTDEERWEAVLQGVTHGKQYVQNIERSSAAKAASIGKSASKMLNKFFRRASARSVAMGKARITMEKAVERAERILLEKKRSDMAVTASNREDIAEAIAQELYHKPGTLLNEKELAHVYQESGCEELRPEDIQCSDRAFYHSVRSFDGTCNNLVHPTDGASFTAFGRIVPAHYKDGIQALFNQANPGPNEPGPFEPPYPSARLVSDTTLRDREVNDTLLTHLVMQWGQFMDHDLDLAVEFAEQNCSLVTCAEDPICAPVRVPQDDQEFGADASRGGLCHPFQRTMPACAENRFELGAREQVNELTHHIDGSMVYGSTATQVNFLREFAGGRLKTSDPLPGQERRNLPFQPPCPPHEGPDGSVDEPEETCCPEGFDQCFAGGDIRAIEHVSLTVMHTIWVREHNRIAAGLAEINSHWDDERLFIESRDIVIAQIQKITLYEYLPVLMGQGNFDRFIPPYRRYNPLIDVSIPNAFATAAYRFGHSQIQPDFERLGPDGRSIPRGPLNLRDSFFSQVEYEEGGGVSPIVRGWLRQPARLVDEFLNSVLTSQLFEPDNEPGQGMDLATLNIQRGRDHGLAPYGVWRRFSENSLRLTGDTELRSDLTRIRLIQQYGSVDAADLFVGALAEEALSGSVLGPTLTAIFVLTFTRLRDGDRFWFENQDENTVELFTPGQLATIRQTSFARVLCDNTEDLRRVQTSVFTQDQFGFFSGSCLDTNLIPGIDLTQWTESITCAYRTVISAASSTNTLFLFGNRGPSSDMASNQQFSLTTGTINECVPFVCPTAQNERVIFSTVATPTRARSCRVQESVGRVGTFSFELMLSDGDLGSNPALFTSLEACDASNNVLITYRCDNTDKEDKVVAAAVEALSSVASTSELESELAKALQNTDTGSAGGQTTTKLLRKLEFLNYRNTTLISDEVRQLLDGAVESPQTTMVKAAEKSTSKVQKSDEKLINLLQATLQELKHKGK